MAPEPHIRRALVTASSAGIGRSIAVELAREGADVVVHGRSQATAEVAAAELDAVDWVSGDLATSEGTEQVRSWLADNEIDVLVNGAGPFAENTYETASPQNWAVALIAAASSSYIIGVDLPVDGGLTGAH